MKFEVLTEFDAIGEQEWDALLTQSAVDSPFQRYGYQSTWWAYKGGGEWKNAELRIITARENGELVGIAPFFMSKRGDLKEIHFIGSVEISDYLDFIVRTDISQEFFRGLFAFIEDENSGFCKSMTLMNIPDSSPNLASIQKIGKAGDWQATVEPAYHTPAIPLAEDWESYLLGINKKQRHEIRRKIRRAESSEDEVRWYIAENETALDENIAAFLRLMENDEQKQRFLTRDMRLQMSAIIQWAAKAGYLQLSFLTVNGKKAAGYLCFDYGKKIWVYNSGFSPEFQYYSPGWVLLSYLIQHAISSGKTHFDFMRGNETYKYRFGGVDSFVMKVKVERTNN